LSFERGDIFMDVDSIRPGADFVQTLEEAVAGCDVFVAVIGPQWLALTDESGRRRLDQWNDFVRIEIASALKQGKLVIPVLVGSARMPSPDDLRSRAIAAQRHRTQPPAFTYDVDKLVAVSRGRPRQPVICRAPA
jgi:hypothetical protein